MKNDFFIFILIVFLFLIALPILLLKWDDPKALNKTNSEDLK